MRDERQFVRDERQFVGAYGVSRERRTLGPPYLPGCVLIKTRVTEAWFHRSTATPAGNTNHVSRARRTFL